MFKLDLEKAEEQQNQIANVGWIIEKASEFQKDTCCFIDHSKFFDCVDDNKLWKILKEMGIPDHITWLLRNLCSGPEAIVRTTWNNELVPNRERRSEERRVGKEC